MTFCVGTSPFGTLEIVDFRDGEESGKDILEDNEWDHANAMEPKDMVEKSVGIVGNIFKVGGQHLLQRDLLLCSPSMRNHRHLHKETHRHRDTYSEVDRLDKKLAVMRSKEETSTLSL